jgi:hypothetical protein
MSLWKRDPVIESRLRPGAEATIDEWREVKAYLLSSFAAYTGQQVDMVWDPIYQDFTPKWGFAFGIRSRGVLGGPLELEWYGVISHNGRHTCAFVLLFAQNERAIHHAGREYLYFEYAPDSQNAHAWVKSGWQSSEMHEWDGYRRLTEVCQQMSKPGQ